jgi:hypothetical protein
MDGAQIAPVGRVAVSEPTPGASSGLSRVCCPKCGWQPNEDSSWSCTPMGHPEYYVHGACGHSWNTFKTGGKCPGCRHRWKNTVCLSCGELSPHKAWYAQPGAGAGSRSP